MKLDLYVAGFMAKENVLKSGCAVVLMALHAEGRKQRRELVHHLGASTLNLANLQAVRIALLAVKPRYYKNHEIILHCNNYYISDILTVKEKDDTGQLVYRVNPKSNQELVEVIRKLFVLTNTKLDKTDSDILNECFALAKHAAIQQTSSDSGTKELADAGLQRENCGDGG